MFEYYWISSRYYWEGLYTDCTKLNTDDDCNPCYLLVLVTCHLSSRKRCHQLRQSMTHWCKRQLGSHMSQTHLRHPKVRQSIWDDYGKHVKKIWFRSDNLFFFFFKGGTLLIFFGLRGGVSTQPGSTIRLPGSTIVPPGKIDELPGSTILPPGKIDELGGGEIRLFSHWSKCHIDWSHHLSVMSRQPWPGHLLVKLTTVGAGASLSICVLCDQ